MNKPDIHITMALMNAEAIKRAAKKRYALEILRAKNKHFTVYLN